MEFSVEISPKFLQEIANKFKESRVLLTALELEIFTVLNKKRLNSEEIALAVNANVRGVDRLLNALVTMGLLSKKGAKFMNYPGVSDYLVKGEQGYLGNLHHTIDLWNVWSTLTDSVKAGTSVFRNKINDRGTEWLEHFIKAMHHRGVNQSKYLSMIMDLSQVNKMLDIGGGSGAFSMGFVEKNPGIDVFLLDLPNVIPLTKRYVEQNNMLDKFTFIEGDYFTSDFGNGYDLIFLSAIIHMNTYEENKELIRKCSTALKKGGQIVIYDFVMDDGRINPKDGAFFALNMLVSTFGGDSYTEKEIKEWLQFAGLNDIVTNQTSFGYSLVIAK